MKKSANLIKKPVINQSNNFMTPTLIIFNEEYNADLIKKFNDFCIDNAITKDHIISIWYENNPNKWICYLTYAK